MGYVCPKCRGTRFKCQAEFRDVVDVEVDGDGEIEWAAELGGDGEDHYMVDDPDEWVCARCGFEGPMARDGMASFRKALASGALENLIENASDE